MVASRRRLRPDSTVSWVAPLDFTPTEVALEAPTAVHVAHSLWEWPGRFGSAVKASPAYESSTGGLYASICLAKGTKRAHFLE
jgi:hypothetical protein